MAFEDISVAALYERRHESEAVYKEIATSGPRKLADLMRALRRSRCPDARCFVFARHGKKPVCATRDAP